ncbi:Uncharacterised protein [Vibrio cholerae]|nr:Uncharacterised protein [Vibrio cholerae]
MLPLKAKYWHRRPVLYHPQAQHCYLHKPLHQAWALCLCSYELNSSFHPFISKW